MSQLLSANEFSTATLDSRPKIAFVIPTLFNRPNLVVQCVESIVANMLNFAVDYEITVVVNTHVQEFDDYQFAHPVTKKCSDLAFNIAKALNVGVQGQEHADYFCYVDEGVTFSDPTWLKKAIEIFKSDPKIGLIGCRPHSTFHKYRKFFSSSPLIYEVLWADGLLIIQMSKFKAVDGFDEKYFADCELQDFGYRLHQAGHKNLFWDGLIQHTLISFKNKHVNKKKLLNLRDRSRKYFAEKWANYEKKLGTVIEGDAPTWPIYLINLNDNLQRFRNSQVQFEALGLPFVRIDAINGWKLSAEQIRKVYDEEACLKDGRHLLIPAEVGCYLSHIEAWKAIAGSTAPGGFVFEDDFSASAQLPDVLCRLSNDFGPWEIVKLFSLQENPKVLMQRPLGVAHQIVLPYKVPTCNTAYAIRKETAQRLVNLSEKFFRAVDEDFKFYWEKKLRIALVLPPPVGLGDQETSTGTIGAARKASQNKSTLKHALKSIKYQANYKIKLAWNRFLERTQSRLKV